MVIYFAGVLVNISCKAVLVYRAITLYCQNTMTRLKKYLMIVARCDASHGVNMDVLAKEEGNV